VTALLESWNSVGDRLQLPMRNRPAPAPFLFLSVRAQEAAADDEYSAIMRFAGLDERNVHRIRLAREPLGPVDLDRWSGVILGGGPYNASDAPEDKSADQLRAEADVLSLLDEVVPRDFPFLGCCYGIGALGMHIGATVDRTFAEPIGSVQISLTVACRDHPLFAYVPDMFEAFVGHKEAVSKLPSDAVLLASSPACPVQAFRVGRNVYATQFHPELDVAGICTRIEVYKHFGYFDPDTADSLKESTRHSNVIYPPAILRRFVERFAA
jgi:GMP synthase (glutamine-hydrolysing)